MPSSIVRDSRPTGQGRRSQAEAAAALIIGGSLLGWGAYEAFKPKGCPAGTFESSGLCYPISSSYPSTPGSSSSSSSVPSSSAAWTWADWWAQASGSDKAALAIWWTLLDREPGDPPGPGVPGSSLTSDPWDAFYYGGCGDISSWLESGSNAQYACCAMRFITDRACEFLSKFGPTMQGPGDICEPGGVSCATYLAAVGSTILGRAWTPDSGDLARCQSASTYDFGPQPLSGPTAAVLVVACSAEYVNRINGLAGQVAYPFA